MWTYLRSIVSMLVVIPTSMILARLLSPADFGIAAAATFFGQLAAKLSSGGMGVALVRVKTLDDDHISSVFVVNTLLAGTFSAARRSPRPSSRSSTGRRRLRP